MFHNEPLQALIVLPKGLFLCTQPQQTSIRWTHLELYMPNSYPWTPVQVATRIEHSCLAPDATQRDIDRLCREALERGFRAVRVNSTWVALCHKKVGGTSVRIIATVGFPFGACTTDTKVFEARQALRDGAHEIDMVMSVGDHNGNDDAQVQRDIAAVAKIVHAQESILDVIIETPLLRSSASKRRACVSALKAGADGIKTCTGFFGSSSNAVDIKLMLEEAARHSAFTGKRAPTVSAYCTGRAYNDVVSLLNAGATNVGTSFAATFIEPPKKE